MIRLRGMLSCHEVRRLMVALRAYEKIGVEHIARQFMVPRWPERREQIERFAQEVMPALRSR